MSFKITGLDDLQKNLQNLADKAEGLSGEHQVSFEDLFVEDFMKSNTKFASFNGLLDESPFTVDTPEDFEAIPDAEFDTYVAEVTEFESWEDMLEEASTQYAARQLGF